MTEVSRISPAGDQCFFGYYDKSPWNASRDKIVYIRARRADRSPRPEDTADILIQDLRNEPSLPVGIGKTHAWNWQQGAMLRWYGDSESLLFNDREGNRLLSRLMDTSGRELQRINHPIYDISQDGDQTASLSFSRLARLRPGYGYAGSAEPEDAAGIPDRDGLFFGSLQGDRRELVVSIRQVSAINPRSFFRGRMHWFNHATFSPTGKRLVFLHRCRITAGGPAGTPRREGPGILDRCYRSSRRVLGRLYRYAAGRSFSGMYSRLFVVEKDGTGLRCLIDSGSVSHFGWRDDENLLVWASVDKRGPGYWMINAVTGKVTEPDAELPGEDGHCSFSRDGSWILTDTYQADAKPGRILLSSVNRQRMVEIGRFPAAKGFSGEFRCDFHPRLRSDRKQVCFDSTHEGFRAVYVADVDHVTNRSTEDRT